MSLVGAAADQIQSLLDYFRQPSPIEKFQMAIEDLYRKENEAHALAINDWTLQFESWCRENGIHYDKSAIKSLDCPCTNCKNRVEYEAFMISNGYYKCGGLWIHSRRSYDVRKYDCDVCGYKHYKTGAMNGACGDCFAVSMEKKLLTTQSKVDMIEENILKGNEFFAFVRVGRVITSE